MCSRMWHYAMSRMHMRSCVPDAHLEAAAAMITSRPMPSHPSHPSEEADYDDDDDGVDAVVDWSGYGRETLLRMDRSGQLAGLRNMLQARRLGFFDPARSPLSPDVQRFLTTKWQRCGALELYRCMYTQGRGGALTGGQPRAPT